MKNISKSVKDLLESIPPHVIMVAAAKGRSLDEVKAAVDAGITHVGHNYVQEAKPMVDALGTQVTWHMIGHLQRNKAKSALHMFDMIETLDSYRLAKVLSRHCSKTGKIAQVLVEINSGRENSKTGVLPEDVEDLVTSISELDRIRVLGLMTMGPRFGNPNHARPYFQATREIYFRLSTLSIPNVTMRYLSMGMSNSYCVAIEEGANVVRIGTKIFGSLL